MCQRLHSLAGVKIDPGASPGHASSICASLCQDDNYLKLGNSEKFYAFRASCMLSVRHERLPVDMNSLIGKFLKQNKRGGVTTRARKHLLIVRAEPRVIHGAGETANRTELQLRDSFFVFG